MYTYCVRVCVCVCQYLNAVPHSKVSERRACSLLITKPGQPGWLSGLAPPSAQGLILETWDQVPRQAPCMEPASPLPLPMSLPLFLYVSYE